jgi:hydroxymethylbilane synthase
VNPRPVTSLFTHTLTLGTRPSALARWQTEHVVRLLQARWPDLRCQILTIETGGDRMIDRPLPEIGGKGLFTQELEGALLSGRIDLAVHSLKDLPIEPTPALTVGAICAREDARDVLISRNQVTFAGLPYGARVGTSSLRRSAQILSVRPDLSLLPLRGNVDTRVRKALAGDYDAIVLAAAGVIRLGLEDRIGQYLPFEWMLPAPGQGALAVQCRANDLAVLRLLEAIDDSPTRTAVTAERAFLAALGGGCSAPVAAYAEIIGDEIALRGLIASMDGRRVIRVSGSGADPTILGSDLAHQAIDQGGADLLP